jgi:hypothetical protein
MQPSSLHYIESWNIVVGIGRDFQFVWSSRHNNSRVSLMVMYVHTANWLKMYMIP